MTVQYSRNATDRMFEMTRTQVRIWNVLHEGPLEASEIVRRLPGLDYFEIMDALHDMAHHMAEHNTAFSEGLIVGVLTDFVKCTREMVLNGNTVKVGNLAIFKATVESNGLEVLYDAQSDKVASATMGTLKEGDKTGAAVKAIKLLAQSTGDFTRDELKKDVKLSWTDKTKAEIAAAKGETAANTGNAGGTSNTGSNTGGTGSNTGGGSTGDNTGGGTQGGDGDHDSDGGTNSDE